MDLYQLDCFRTVARMEHISNAAVVLHITQPALSKIISRVEDYAGAPLFDRVKGKIHLNATGAAFLRTLDDIFDKLEKGKREVLEIHARESNQVRLAASCDSILFMLAEDFFSTHSEVRVRYSVMSHEQIREAFLRNTLDFALTTYPVQEKGVEWEFFAQEEIVMVVSRDSEFYGRKVVPFSELHDVEMMCSSNGDDLREVINQSCEQAGFSPNVVLESSPGSIMGFSIGLNRAVSFMPIHRFMQLHERRRPQEDERNEKPLLGAVRLIGPRCSWVTGLAHRPAQELNPLAEQFYKMTKEYFEGLHQKITDFSESYFGDTKEYAME